MPQKRTDKIKTELAQIQKDLEETRRVIAEEGVAIRKHITRGNLIFLGVLRQLAIGDNPVLTSDDFNSLIASETAKLSEEGVHALVEQQLKIEGRLCSPES